MDSPLEKPSETRPNAEKPLEARPDPEKTVETKPSLEKPAGGKKKSTRLLEGKRVFIVEDDVTNLAIASVLLKQHGAEVGFERWGANTMTLLKLMAPVDIILLDLNLQHGVSGLNVYDTIRQDEAFAKVPIVAVSALDPSLAIPQTKKKGFSGFISKPVEFNLFAEQVAKVIDGGEVWYAV